LDHVHGGKITAVQVNGGGNTPNGKANGVPKEYQNPTGFPLRVRTKTRRWAVPIVGHGPLPGICWTVHRSDFPRAIRAPRLCILRGIK
jgi:hypothetical protein